MHKILIGNKCDWEEKRAVTTEQGQQLADELGIPFLEVSAKNNINIENAFYNLASDIKRGMDTSKSEQTGPQSVSIDNQSSALSSNSGGKCCWMACRVVVPSQFPGISGAASMPTQTVLPASNCAVACDNLGFTLTPCCLDLLYVYIYNCPRITIFVPLLWISLAALIWPNLIYIRVGQFHAMVSPTMTNNKYDAGISCMCPGQFPSIHCIYKVEFRWHERDMNNLLMMLCAKVNSAWSDNELVVSVLSSWLCRMSSTFNVGKGVSSG